MSEPVYLDSYVLQQDMRIRLPKQILNNLPVVKGQTRFAIYYDNSCGNIILKIEEATNETRSNDAT